MKSAIIYANDDALNVETRHAASLLFVVNEREWHESRSSFACGRPLCFSPVFVMKAVQWTII
jgi:hypothetical protein